MSVMFNFKSIPRLTIIFILAVTIPGGVLSYLSIQNITNLKELAERRVLEEEEILAGKVKDNFNEHLDSITLSFQTMVSQLQGNTCSRIQSANTIAFLDNPFILDKEGSFLWPVFTDDITYEEESFPAGFVNNFNAAERYEFSTRNYSGALSLYRRALSRAGGKRDTAKALNALGRLYHKMGKETEAEASYYQLISDYGSARDIYGLPYAYYALPQLLELSDTGNVELLADAIIIVLHELEDGSIPLNPSTEMLITDITGWLDHHSSENLTNHHDLLLKVNSINNRISFITSCNSTLKDFVSEGNKSFLPKISGEFYVIVPPVAMQEELVILLYETKNDHIAGFLLWTDSLAYHAAGIGTPPFFNFKYNIGIYRNEPDSLQGDEVLSTRVQLNPALTDRSVFVRLEDKHLLEKDIRRTSWIYGVAITLLLGGMLLGVFLIIRDISREKRLSRLRSEFVSNVTHELKTPLTSIYMFAESMLLGRVKTRSEQKEYLGIILKETDRLKRLINNILDFSKKEKGKLVYNFMDVNISELIRSALYELDYWISEKHFKLLTSIEDDVVSYVDPDALKQTVLNLLSNAMKYSREEKEISVNLYRKESSITIEIIDKGIGIPEDKRERIFDKFYRIEDDNDPENIGTGLGLTVVKEIVDAHGASVELESEPGKGSKFTIILNSE